MRIRDWMSDVCSSDLQMVLKDKHNQTVSFEDVVASGKNIGLFFAAGWHDKSTEYLPQLIPLYSEVNRKNAKGTGNGLDIIYEIGKASGRARGGRAQEL